MILNVKGLSRNYGKKVVLNDVSFHINRQEIVGLVGPNGAGKTTLLNILTGMMKATTGTFEVPEKHSLTAAISRKGFFGDMTVYHNLRMYAGLIGVGDAEVNTALKEFSIDFPSKPFGQLSAGMKQRVALASAFLKPYALILLDEPTNHLDIDSILSLRDTISVNRNRGASFLITSHVFSDLEKICDRIMFLKNGTIAGNATLPELLGTYGNLESAYIEIFKTK